MIEPEQKFTDSGSADFMNETSEDNFYKEGSKAEGFTNTAQKAVGREAEKRRANERLLSLRTWTVSDGNPFQV